MAHEITNEDGLMLTGKRAWHGLGVIVEDAPDAYGALNLASLDWQVDQCPLVAITQDGVRVNCGDNVANVRKDTNKILGIVGKDWQPFQNSDMADFIDALVENDDKIKIESAGSIRGGQKVWFLVRGESFSVRKDSDLVNPYILVSNGFDGMTSLRCTPTTIRVVCSNTLHMVLPNDVKFRRRSGETGFSIKHTGRLMDRVKEAQSALELYGKGLNETRRLIDFSASSEVNSEFVKEFFMRVYGKQFGKIDLDNERQMRKIAKHASEFMNRFDQESSEFGANRWTVFNAYTGWLQHDKIKSDRANSMDAKVSRNIFGVNSERTVEALELALSM